MRRSRARGVTLIELMVALVIGLMISLAAAALYLGVRETSRATQAASDIHQTGKLALDIVGRELEKAGFYPTEFPSSAGGSSQLGAYSNIENPNAAAALKQVFDQGLYGCNGSRFDPGTTTCVTPTGATSPVPDSVVINYFASQEFGATTLMGNSNDCNRAPVSNDSTANGARGGLPLFVSNRFALVAQTLQGPDGAVSTNFLGCHGNGNQAGDYQPLLQGIDDMVIGYGLPPTTGGYSPERFLAANALTAGDWPRVTAVRLCFIVRSIDSNVRQADKSGAARTKPSCRDGMTSPPATPTALAASDHYIYRKFEQVFAIRNALPDLL